MTPTNTWLWQPTAFEKCNQLYDLFLFQSCLKLQGNCFLELLTCGIPFPHMLEWFCFFSSGKQFLHNEFILTLFYFPYCPACCRFDIFSFLILLANKAQFINALFQILIIEFKIRFLSRLALFKLLFWEKLEQIKISRIH